MHIETRQVIYLDLFVAALLAMIESESLRKKAIKQDETEEYHKLCFWSRVDKKIMCFEDSSLSGKIGSFFIIYLLKLFDIVATLFTTPVGIFVLIVSFVIKTFH